jgi:type II secretory pathway component GspD/PulD (secretin)
MKGWTLPVLLAGLASAGPLGAGPDYRLVEPDAAEAASRLDARVRSFHVARAPVDAALLAVGRAYGFTFVADARDGSLRELIDALAKTAGCYWELQGRVIALGRNVTRFYELDYPQMSRSSQGGSNVILSAQSGAGAGPGSAQGAGASVPSAAANQTDQTNLTILQQNQNTFWPDVQAELAALCRPGESVLVNRFAGLAAVTAPPFRQDGFREFIDRLNRRISRQVRIAARVVEVELNSQHQLGVDWTLAAVQAGGLSLSGVGTASGFSSINGTALGAPAVSGTLATGKVSAVIRALSAQGEVRAVSNPSVVSLSNQTAFVKVGTEQTFFSLSNSTVINQAGAATPVATTQNSYAQNAITIGTVLYVTPEVNADGTVTVDVLPAITQLIGVDTSPDGQQTAPRMDIKALSTIARLHPDQSVMIGGLIYDATARQSQGVPWLQNLPVVGKAFGTAAVVKTRTELVIFLTAEPVG